MRAHLPILQFVLLAAIASTAACHEAAADSGPRGAAPARDVPGRIVASPLVSRGKRVAAWSSVRFADPSRVNDGDPWTVWEAGRPTPERPAWVAIDVGRGPTRLLLTWSAAGSFNYDETDYGSPGAYRVETSPDSTDGKDGAWKVVARADQVGTHAGAHGFDFAGQRWVKLVITGTPARSPNGVQIDEIRVHDASRGAGDTWFFMGDSITAFAFGRPPASGISFADRIHQRHATHDPAVVNGGIGGHKSDEGLARVDTFLAQNPDARFWAIGYGTNDAAGDARDTARFQANLQGIIDRVRAAGRVPVLATIPAASDGHHRHIPLFNAVIDDLTRANALPRGPDLYAWFSRHPDQLRDGIHPSEEGIASINRLWAEAVDPLYPP
jgi:lysophospholipase L1-like esterase